MWTPVQTRIMRQARETRIGGSLTTKTGIGSMMRQPSATMGHPFGYRKRTRDSRETQYAQAIYWFENVRFGSRAVVPQCPR